MDIVTRLLAYFVLLFAITIHEAAHGWAAMKLGDPTAFHLGRVTLNPIPHIDPIGTLILPIFVMLTGIPFFGWAKPVPVNPLNLRNPRRDNLWISFAGPLSNLTAATACLIGLGLLKAFNPQTKLFFLSLFTGRYASAGGFTPLDGLAMILYYGALINTFLAVFNLIPVPPLDGSGVLSGLVSSKTAAKIDLIRPYGFFIILALLFMGFLDLIFRPIHYFIINIILT